MNKINNLKSNGGTCLGKGLKQGMDVSVISKYHILYYSKISKYLDIEWGK